MLLSVSFLPFLHIIAWPVFQDSLQIPSPLWSLPGFSWAGLTTRSIAASVFLVASVFSLFCATLSCYTENVLSTAVSTPSTVDCELLKDRDHEVECPVNTMWRITFDSWFRIFCFVLGLFFFPSVSYVPYLYQALFQRNRVRMRSLG